MKSRSINEYIFFLEAWLLLHVSRFVIVFFPFKKISSFLGSLNHETGRLNDNKLIAKNIEHAIRRAVRYTFYTSKCYDQALAGKQMFKFRHLPSTIYFGLSKNDKSELVAHAWLRFGNTIITGQQGVENYTVVAFYGELDFINPNSQIDNQS